MSIFKRFCALLLVVAALLLPVSCGNGGGGKETKKPGKNTTAGETSAAETEFAGTDWAQVDFGGEILRISVSCNQGYEVTYKPADAYTKGPDEISSNTDSVQKLVYDRNRNVADLLGLSVEYIESDLKYDAILDDIQQWVRVGGDNSPDIYNNDVYGLSRGMVNDMLWNVATPGDDVVNYFNLDADCWFREYMNGMTYTPEKRYVLAGDYFLDIIRMAWLYYVNLDLLDEYCPEGYDQEWLYWAVEEREWDLNSLMFIAECAWRDTGKEVGATDKEDSCLGAMINHCSAFIMTQAAGQSHIGIGEDGRPYVIENNPDYFDFANKFYQFFNATGIYYEYNVENSTILFMNDNVLFAQSVLGEMESEDMRNLGFVKGVVPLPIWDLERQKDYNTITHDQAEAGGILTTTRKFTEASAYMQCINEKSSPVLKDYYEQELKLRYNEDVSTKKMIDIVYETIGSPFGLVFQNAVNTLAPLPEGFVGPDLMTSAENHTNDFTSKYASAISAWKQSLEKAYALFMELN